MDVPAGDTEVGGRDGIIVPLRNFDRLPVTIGDLTPPLRRVVLVGEEPLGGGLDLAEGISNG